MTYDHPEIDVGKPLAWPGFALCAEVEHVPDFAGYRMWQRKADGVRAYLSTTHLMLRGRRPIKHEIRLCGEPVPTGWLLDGELLAIDGQATDVLGRVTRRQWGRLRFEAFDVLTTEHRLMTPLPYIERWTLLQDMLPAEHLVEVFCEPLSEMPPVPPDWEGIVGKLPDRPWRPGRSRDAAKWKNFGFIQAVITGFDQGSGAWSDSVGTVRFGLVAPTGRLVEVGRAGGLTAADRARFTADPDRFVGQACRIKHYGMNKTHLRNPVFVQLDQEVTQ